jgi:signal transduction histidine kinase
MFHTASFELALTLIAAARSRPALAGAIRRSTRRPDRHDWVVEFLRHPRWERLLDEARGAAFDDDAIALEGHAAAFRAAVNGDGHEAVFWEAQSSPASVRIATTNAESFDDDRASMEHRAWDGPPAPAPLPDHWRLSAEREALRQSAATTSLQFDLATVDDLAAFIQIARRTAEINLGADVAVWIGERSAGRGIGVGPLVATMEGSSKRFERDAVPWFFRQSRTFEVSNGFAATVYAGVPIEGLDEWATLLRKARGLDSLQPLVVDHGSVEAEVDARYWSAVAEFGAGAGHTINNPLGAIAGLAERLLVGEAAPDRRESLHKIRMQVDRIHRMIRDLHLLGRAVKPPTAAASLAEGVRQGVSKALARFADQPTARCTIHEISFNVVVPLATADLVRLVEELVANAVDAAGPGGFVEVRCAPSVGAVDVQIIDSGRGFAAADLANAFSPFYAGRTAGRGLGMGLPVCRRIAERIDGRIVIAGRRPTTVIARLPIDVVELARQAA